MVSLTSQLLLAELFQLTSKIIPKTAYLKLIDVWYTTLCIFNFLMVLNLVSIEVYRLVAVSYLTEESNVFKNGKGRDDSDDENDKTMSRIELVKKNLKLARKWNTRCVVVYPGGIVLFLLIIAGLANDRYIRPN